MNKKVLVVVIGALCIALVGVTVLATSLNTRLEAEDSAEYKAGYEAGVIDQNERWLSWDLDGWDDFLAEYGHNVYVKEGSSTFPFRCHSWPGQLPFGYDKADISGLEAGKTYHFK